MNRSLVAIFVSVAIFGSTATVAATRDDIDALTTYAVFIGRGVACGVDIKPEMQRIGTWMNRRFPPGSEDLKTYMPIFIQGVEYHAQLQKDGKSPDSCSKVRTEYPKLRWP